MGGAPLAFAFAAGMVATVNPCGFAMLPAYLSYFVGLEHSTAPRAERRDRVVLRALAIAAVLTLAFVAVFGVIGMVVTQFSTPIQRHLPWVTIVIGIALIVLGIAAIAGRPLTVRLPKLQKGGTSRELSSMFVFGLSYALSSLSCTLYPFLSATSLASTNSGTLAVGATFVAYGLGMGALVALLTVVVGLAGNGAVARSRHLLRYVNPVSGALMILAGAYTAYYGWYEIRLRSKITDDPIVDRAQQLQRELQDLVERAGTGRVGVAAALVVAAALGTAALRRARQHTGSNPTEVAPAATGSPEPSSPGSVRLGDGAGRHQPERAVADPTAR